MEETVPQKNTLNMPLAIVVAGTLIAGAIFFSRGATPPVPEIAKQAPSKPLETAETNLRPVDATDHIRGNPNAAVTFVEYSDTECPFCKTFHMTMRSVIDEYGKSGQVAWVYRHFPLVQLHQKAPKEAEAVECAGELAGNTGFWDYLDELFRVTPSNDGLPSSELLAIAERTGLSRDVFEACLESGRYAERVTRDSEDAVSSGGSGTPWTIITLATPIQADAKGVLTPVFSDYRDPYGGPLIRFSDDDMKISMSGALPLALIRLILETLLP